MRKVLVTGGAGYIGSALTYFLLGRGWHVRVLDNLTYGGDALLGALHHPRFEFIKGDIRDGRCMVQALEGVNEVVHLAAIVGFPACRKYLDAAKAINLEATKELVHLCKDNGVARFVFASTYSNYGLTEDGGMATEESLLHPQSLYAETKVRAEEYILNNFGEGFGSCVLRFATAFGLSPRMRFDLLINQFVMEAMTKGKLIIYQGQESRAFVHVADIARAIALVLEAPSEKVCGEVYNVGSNALNYRKRELAGLIQRTIPGITVEFIEKSYDEDMRDVRLSCDKIHNHLSFQITRSVKDGSVELRDALSSGLIADPLLPRFYEIER